MLVEPSFFFINFHQLKPSSDIRGYHINATGIKVPIFFLALQNKHVTKLAHLQKSQ